MRPSPYIKFSGLLSDWDLYGESLCAAWVSFWNQWISSFILEKYNLPLCLSWSILHLWNCILKLYKEYIAICTTYHLCLKLKHTIRILVHIAKPYSSDSISPNQSHMWPGLQNSIPYQLTDLEVKVLLLGDSGHLLQEAGEPLLSGVRHKRHHIRTKLCDAILLACTN